MTLSAPFTTGIYGYMDIVWIAWTLGLLWLAALAAAGARKDPRPGLRAGLAAALAEERFLFGGWAGALRQAAGGWLFAASMAILQFNTFFVNSLVRTSGAGWYRPVAFWLETAFYFPLVFKMIFCTRYSLVQLGSGYCFFFVFRWVYLNSAHLWPAMGMLFFLAAKDVPMRRTLKICLLVSAASFLAVVLGSAAGFVDTLVIEADARPRNSFGYGWFNLTGAILLGICVMYVCWRQAKNLKWFDFALLAAAAAFCNWGPDSRSATVCILLLMALAALARFWPAAAKPLWVRALVSAAPAAAFAVSLLGSRFYTPDSRLFVLLDKLFTGRLSLAGEALAQTHIAIAGQRFTEENYIVDNLYANLWIWSGPVASVMLWGAVTVLLWRLMKKGALSESAGLVVMLAHAAMEGHFVWPCINVCLWLLPCVLYLLPPERTPSFAAEAAP